MEELIKAYITFLAIWSQSQNWSYALAHANFAILYKIFNWSPLREYLSQLAGNQFFLVVFQEKQDLEA